VESRPEEHGLEQHGLEQHGLEQHGLEQHGPEQHGPEQHGPEQHGPEQHGPEQHGPAFITGGAYALLFLVGAAQGVIGCFQFSSAAGPIPLAAIGFCVLIVATCLLGAAGMGSAVGALVPAAGWFLVSLVLTMPTAQGSVIVTNTAAGEWYLYGGSACAVAAVLIALVRRRGGAPGPGHAAAVARATDRATAPGPPPRGTGL
jgi:hypothetical protein